MLLGLDAKGPDHRADGGVEDAPLVDAVLAHWRAGVHRGHMRGGRRRELALQVHDAPALDEPPQQRMLVPALLEGAPAERVEKDDDRLLAGAHPGRISAGMSAKPSMGAQPAAAR